MFTKFVRLLLCFSLIYAGLLSEAAFHHAYAEPSNLVVNQSFEQNLIGWQDWGGVSIVTTPVAGGGKAARMGTGESGAGQIVTGITAGTVYTLSGSGRVSVGGEHAIIGVDCMNSSGTKLASGKFELNYDSTSYNQKSLGFKTVAGTSQIQVYIYKNPNVGGYAYVDNISLTKQDGSSGDPGDIGTARKAMWVWNLNDIATASSRSDIINFALSKGTNLFYLNTGYYEGDNYLVAHPQYYRALIASAHLNGIRVESLDGASEWVRAANHSIPLSRIQDVLNYNAASALNERFDGIHHDNEPYTLSDWGTNKQMLGADYLELARKSKQKLIDAGTNMTYSGDIPFWYETVSVTYNGVNKEMYKHILDEMDYVAIMDYRDYAEGSDGIIANAQNEINYAASVGKKVIIGVETYDVPGDPSFVTFYQEGENYMNQELAKVQSYYSGSTGYAGYAIHYYTTYRTMTWGPRQ
ncbi:hypothetical protein GCM10008018_30550 [Paenibacillus marchantiophytorum]|uniref:Uncharacterized protein n=1 Tax=Paenibacillus marchantiophytorum TaxID=1619310 RepID=A0ABQ1EQT2_9BACL|nr:carbohydrate-binding protein [Paenibacillus marchantiophytorum]GFZ82619.1 hypothetical protein GCM10008018_30550 [Paenibacillus marchantiophytorum]